MIVLEKCVEYLSQSLLYRMYDSSAIVTHGVVVTNPPGANFIYNCFISIPGESPSTFQSNGVGIVEIQTINISVKKSITPSLAKNSPPSLSML